MTISELKYPVRFLPKAIAYPLSLLRNICYLFRGLLIPIGYMIFIGISFDYIKDIFYGIPMLLLVFIGLPISIIMCIKQISKDAKFLRTQHAYKIYKSLYEEGYIDNLSINKYSRKEHLNEVCTEEYVWDTINNKAYGSFHSYMIDFKNRNDKHAKSMRRTITKNGMKDVIANSIRCVHSIQFWENIDMISFDYGIPIKIKDIISFEILNNSSIQRGRAYTSGYSTHQVKSYSFLTNSYKYKTKITETTSYEPDRIINEFTLYLSLRNASQPCVQLRFGENQNLAQEIKSRLTFLMDRYKHNINYNEVVSLN